MCLPPLLRQLPFYSVCGSNEKMSWKVRVSHTLLCHGTAILAKDGHSDLSAGFMEGLYVRGQLWRLSPSVASVIMSSCLLTCPRGKLDHRVGVTLFHMKFLF